MPIKKHAAKKPVPKRRSPVARAEGERRLIAAAKELTNNSPISEVGVREIAHLADVNHGFVHIWFGSKNKLLLAMARQRLVAIAESVSLAAPGAPPINFFDPEVVSTVRLVLWLNLEGVDATDLFANMPILDALTARYIEVEKIDPTIAREAAIQAIAIGLGVNTFGPFLGMNETSNVVPVMKLWRHILGLLAKHPLK